MKSVTQEHASGCAVACVAAVLGITYKRALKLFDNPEYAGTRGYYCREIVKALANARKTYAHSSVRGNRKKQLVVPLSFVYVSKSARYPMGHWLVRNKKGSWMDPWMNFPELMPAKSGFRNKLPGKAGWTVYPQQ